MGITGYMGGENRVWVYEMDRYTGVLHRRNRKGSLTTISYVEFPRTRQERMDDGAREVECMSIEKVDIVQAFDILISIQVL